MTAWPASPRTPVAVVDGIDDDDRVSERLPGVVVEVFCRCDPAIAVDRYTARAPRRHPGHFDRERSRDDLWNHENARPIAGGWALVEVDTDTPVDVPALVDLIRGAQG